MKRVLVALALVLLAACGAEKAPKVVHTGEATACKADTSTLKAMEDASFATTNAYTDHETPLHKATAGSGNYTITIVDARCGTVGHTVGQTPQDN